MAVLVQHSYNRTSKEVIWKCPTCKDVLRQHIKQPKCSNGCTNELKVSPKARTNSRKAKAYERVRNLLRNAPWDSEELYSAIRAANLVEGDSISQVMKNPSHYRYMLRFPFLESHVIRIAWKY